MADRSTNEYLRSTRAQNDEKDLFSAIGKQVLNLKLGGEDDVPEDERVKVVDEIESLCMSCEENVSKMHESKPFDYSPSQGYNTASSYESSFL